MKALGSSFWLTVSQAVTIRGCLVREQLVASQASLSSAGSELLHVVSPPGLVGLRHRTVSILVACPAAQRSRALTQVTHAEAPSPVTLQPCRSPLATVTTVISPSRLRKREHFSECHAVNRPCRKGDTAAGISETYKNTKVLV